MWCLNTDNLHCSLGPMEPFCLKGFYQLVGRLDRSCLMWELETAYVKSSYGKCDVQLGLEVMLMHIEYGGGGHIPMFWVGGVPT